MSIPIPNYLKPIAVPGKEQKNWTHFGIRCTCGCERFSVYQNYLNKQEKLLEKPYYDALNYLYSGGGTASMCTHDEDGTPHHWKLYEPMKGLAGKHEEVFFPERPYFSGIVVIKIQCAQCGEEHVLFDSRIHGYDGMTGEEPQEVMDYEPHFQLKCREAVSLAVKVENLESFEEFNEEGDLGFTEEQYADAFSWIVIYKINGEGKKSKIFDWESA